jgi:site-specific DNA recombinase
MIAGGRIALYARVSSEAQARDNTIASRVASLQERITGDGYLLEPDDCYVVEGYSGSILLRPALERIRDAAASGRVERVYVHVHDRLARRYAPCEALIIDELRRAGVEIFFLHRPIGDTAEDDLLLQVQSVIAEYERAKILERSRRHAARSGSVARSPERPSVIATSTAPKVAEWRVSRLWRKQRTSYG